MAPIFGVAVLGVVIADDAGAAFLPWDGREGAEVRPHDDIAEAGLPVREGQRPDDLIPNIPAKNNVALRKSFAFRRGQEVLRAHPLATEDPIEVAAADLDAAQMVLVDEMSGDLDVHRACLPPSSVGRIVPERLVHGAAI